MDMSKVTNYMNTSEISMAVNMYVVANAKAKEQQQELVAVTSKKGGDDDYSNDDDGGYEDSIKPIIHSLTTDFTLRFYIYTDEAITQQRQYPFWWKNNDTSKLHNDIKTILPFFHHPARTLDPNQADLFLVPIPLAKMNKQHHIPQIALPALVRQPTFGDGHGHFIMVQEASYFDGGSAAPKIRKINREWADRLSNVTIVRRTDIHGVQKITRTTQDWRPLFRRFQPLHKTGVTIGLVSWELPYIPASWKRFLSQPYWIFYHIRAFPFFHGSTPYRRAPLNITDWPHDFPVSMGISDVDLPYEEWRRRYTSSKFCLIIRGDDPTSKAVYRSVEVGCVPVIVSDYMTRFAAPFAGPGVGMKMEDFCHFIPEAEFMANPRASLLGLRNLSKSYLVDKIRHLRDMAQRIMSIKHPQSLFVPAVLKEVHAVNPRTNTTVAVAKVRG